MAFERLVGHRRVKDQLARALAGGSVHHAHIFSGPPGVGKRLAAEEFARAWLCLEAGPAPCGACASCSTLAAGSHPDFLAVVPLEERKKISIDQVRELGAWLSRTPALGRRKLALLDPADALLHDAANALLKTLEEPPPGRVVVLVAARPGALPPTVRSRCQRVPFGSLEDDEVAEVLRRAGWPAQAARLAAGLADGSPGLALQREGKLWQETDEAVRAVLAALADGQAGAALAFAEVTGAGRERTLAALQVLAALARQSARRLLGAAGEAPPWLAGLDPGRLGRLAAEALELQRRLEGDRPPNPKLALGLLLLGPAGGRGGAAESRTAAAARGGGPSREARA